MTVFRRPVFWVLVGLSAALVMLLLPIGRNALDRYHKANDVFLGEWILKRPTGETRLTITRSGHVYEGRVVQVDNGVIFTHQVSSLFLNYPEISYSVIERYSDINVLYPVLSGNLSEDAESLNLQVTYDNEPDDTVYGIVLHRRPGT